MHLIDVLQSLLPDYQKFPLNCVFREKSNQEIVGSILSYDLMKGRGIFD